MASSLLMWARHATQGARVAGWNAGLPGTRHHANIPVKAPEGIRQRGSRQGAGNSV
jgi:hypothetical protein